MEENYVGRTLEDCDPRVPGRMGVVKRQLVLPSGKVRLHVYWERSGLSTSIMLHRVNGQANGYRWTT